MATRKSSTASRRAVVSKKLKSAATQGKRVHVIPQKGNWAVKREGAQRADRVVSKKTTAILRAKSIARSGTAPAIIVHRKDGTIEKRVTPRKAARKKRS